MSSYVGQSIWIAFHHKANDQYEIWIDDVTVNLGNSSWIPAPGPGPITSPYILEGLDSETQYAVRVKAICGGTDGESAWSDVVSFMTDIPCATPYDLNVTNITATSATLKWTGYQDSYTVKYGKQFFYDNFDENYANDWTRNDGSVYNWTGTTDYFVMLGMASSGTQYLITPDLSDIAGGNILEFSQRYYQGSMTFYVGYSSTTSNTSAFTWGSAVTASLTAMSHIENIPTGTKYIAIRTTATNSSYGLVIDEFRIYSQTITTANAETLPINGLDPNSDYFYQVQGVNCDGNGGTTRWSAIANFTTTDLETWATAVNSKPSTYTAGATVDLHNANDLAWAISVVNGLNGQSAAPGTNFNVVADINMDANNWVPIGTSVNPYTGTFNANGHHIEGLHSLLNTENMGMFGSLNGTVENMILYASFTQGNPVNMGTVAATMSGGTISNVETGGTLTGGALTTSMGGLVGNKTGGTIHSSFAVNTITSGNATTHVGGLVGNNTGNLYNSYANTIISGTGQIGGLVGNNTGTVENCYAVVGSQSFPAFAYNNNGTIQICYADNANGYVGSGTAPTGHGTYTMPLGRKVLGYMYGDNAVSLVSGQSGNNSYVASALAYNSAGTQIEKWPGLLSALNQWVNGHSGYTPWFRPTSSNINGDLPVLGFPSDNCLGTIDADGKYLAYGSTYNSANGLDDLLYILNNNVGDAASSLFLYGNATGVSNVPESQVKTFINEDACLIQANGAGDFINTTVGITFDNSCGGANSSLNTSGSADLLYDWHLMSTPLRNAPMGATYSKKEGTNYIPDETNTFQNSPVDIATLVNSYFPNGLTMGANLGSSDVKWDFYCYFEPEYHWINLKRNRNNHFHYEVKEGVVMSRPFQEDADGLGNHYQINYDGTDQSATTTGDDGCVFTPGKGYMMAISEDSYMSSTGTLNKGEVTIPVTYTPQSPEWVNFNQGANLIGNPYQAYLDLEEVATENTYSTFFVYVAEEDEYMPYHKDQSTNTWTPSRYIHPHQAFFVQKEEEGTENFTFTPSMATATKEDHSYFRSDHIDYPLINLLVENAEGTKNYTIIEVNRPEAGGAERVDALNNANFDLYTSFDQKDYKLFFTPEGEQRVAVFFKTQEDGKYTFTWETHNGMFDQLTLIDNITGVEYDMLTHDSYTFDGKATDYAVRFYILFHVKVDPQDPNNNDHSFAFFDGTNWIINGEGQLELIDMTGRVLYSTNVNGEQSSVSFNSFAAGAYTLRLVKNQKDVKTQKIVIY